MQKRVHLIFIGMIVMADMFIYILLGLLLDGYSIYYGQGRGSHPTEGSGLTRRLVSSIMYIWSAINLIVVLVIVYRKILKIRRRPARVRNVSKIKTFK